MQRKVKQEMKDEVGKNQSEVHTVYVEEEGGVWKMLAGGKGKKLCVSYGLTEP